jgi:hypothetical protein
VHLAADRLAHALEAMHQRVGGDFQQLAFAMRHPPQELV